MRANPDIAVVLDEDSFKYFGDGEPLFNAVLTAQKQWQLGFIGRRGTSICSPTWTIRNSGTTSSTFFSIPSVSRRSSGQPCRRV